MAYPKTIQLKIHERTGVTFDGEVRGVSAYNEKGLFDVLPVHTNFISVLRRKLILHKIDGSKQELNIDSGVMRVLTNKVTVYIGIK